MADLIKNWHICTCVLVLVCLHEYLKARAVSLKVVKKAKRDHQKRSCEQLERDLGCPKRFWRALK